MTWTPNMSENAKVKKGCKRQTGGKRIAAAYINNYGHMLFKLITI
jgi:hypothetical protein